MKIIFAGTPEFARVALQQLVLAGFEIPLVLTQPDRPAGRGLHMQASAVKQFAQEQGFALAQPRSMRLDGKYPGDAGAAHAAIAAAQADVMVVAAYGLILPQWVLDAPRYGCLNIHASLLPRWRGAAPIHRAIEAGDEQTGITIMQMDAGLDTGDMLLVENLAIAHVGQSRDTTASLHDKLATLGGQCVVRTLHLLAQDGLQPVPQPQGDNPQITYARKIDKSEARIDWAQSAAQIDRKVRALTPAPGCTTLIQGELVKVLQTHLEENCYENNSVLRSKNVASGIIVKLNADAISVQCGSGILHATHLQRPGGKRMAAAEFARGFALSVGQRLE